MCRTTINAESTAGVCASCPLYHVKGGCGVDLIACPQCGYHSLPQEHPRPGQGDPQPSMLKGVPSPGSDVPSHGNDVSSPGSDVSSPGDSVSSRGNGGPPPVLPQWDGSAATCSGALRLSEVSPGTEARLLGFSGIDDDYLGRLTAYGLLPGVSIEVLQRFPAIIVGVYQAELALETELADGVWVLPS
jgi:Fe2+ transport system protein FeoA